MRTTYRKMILATSVAICSLLATASCSSSDDEQDAPTESKPAWDTDAAPDATWTNLSGLMVPTADQGPKYTDPVRYGYDESPQGAVLAAINGQVQLAVTGDSEWPEMARLIIAPGQGRDQWAQGRALASVQGSVDEKSAAKFKGFKVNEFSESRAIVTLAIDYPEIGLVATPVQLERLSGDWRLVLPTQDKKVEAVEIDNLDKFTKFSAEG